MASQRVLIGYLIVAATLLVGATADTYTVGDQLGWTIPPGGDNAYRTWAATKSFELGDIIEFRWNNTHTVAQVSKDDYDNCNISNPIGTIQTTSPASYTLNSTDSRYFICTVGNHCRLGQKVTISIGSSAASVTTSALSAIFLALAISFLSLM